MQYREVRTLDSPRFATVSGLGPGWHRLAAAPNSHGLGVHDIHYNQEATVEELKALGHPVR